jgi:uncharacterized protein (DUF1499 family)
MTQDSRLKTLKTMNILKIIGIAAGVAVAGAASLAIMNPTNIAETSADAKEEALRPRIYKTDLQNFVSETEKIIADQTTYGKSWKFIATDTNGNSASIKAEVPVVFFTDDLVVKAEFKSEKGETIINVRSNSRVGKSDLGENRRHVLQILQVLDEKFAK